MKNGDSLTFWVILGTWIGMVVLPPVSIFLTGPIAGIFPWTFHKFPILNFLVPLVITVTCGMIPFWFYLKRKGVSWKGERP